MRILIVDDDPGILNAFEVGLTSQGHELITAQNGRKALRIIESALNGNKPIKLMVTDYLMPGINGLELVRLTHKKQPDLKAIIMTAYGNSSVRKEAIKVGRYIEKPFAPERLISMIKELNG